MARKNVTVHKDGIQVRGGDMSQHCELVRHRSSRSLIRSRAVRCSVPSLYCIVLVARAGSAVSQPHGQASASSENFGRMFNLPPFAPQNDAVTQALIKLETQRPYGCQR